MTSRIIARSKFLQNTEWHDWDVTPIAQDASSRSYLRFSNQTQSVILMDAPPDTGETTKPFVDMAHILNRYGLAAPRIFKQDVAQGFLVLEDLGKTDFAKHIANNPGDALDLYQSATDVLIEITQKSPPKLDVMTPEIAGDMVRISCEFYVRSPDLANQIAAIVTEIFTCSLGPANTLALRDFHAENLIWRPELNGLAQVGLLDFQDAFIAPAGYDLASLLFDARRDVDPAIVTHMIGYYADKTGQSQANVSSQLACLSAQRNLRILGVFGRLIKTKGKTRYAEMLPRVWGHIMHNLSDPALAELRPLVRKGIPDPATIDFSE